MELCISISIPSEQVRGDSGKETPPRRHEDETDSKGTLPPDPIVSSSSILSKLDHPR